MNNGFRIQALFAALTLCLTLPSTLAEEGVLAGAGVPAVTATSVLHGNVTNRFEIRGMHCGGCAGGLQAELKLVPGVGSAEVSFPKRLAVVAYDTNRVSQSQLLKVVREAGFEAVPLSGRKGRQR